MQQHLGKQIQSQLPAGSCHVAQQPHHHSQRLLRWFCALLHYPVLCILFCSALSCTTECKELCLGFRVQPWSNLTPLLVLMRIGRNRCQPLVVGSTAYRFPQGQMEGSTADLWSLAATWCYTPPKTPLAPIHHLCIVNAGPG